MVAKLALERLVRLLCLAFLLLTSLYCLIAYVPFTYEHVIKFRLISWVTAFSEVHAFLYAAVAILLTFSVRDALRRPGSRWLAWSFVSAQLVLAVFFLVCPMISGLQNDAGSLAWSIVFLGFAIWLGAIDLAACRGRLCFGEPEEGRDWTVFVAGLATAVFVSLLYLGVAVARTRGYAADATSGPDVLLILAWSLLSHLVVFLALAAVFVFLSGLARLSTNPAGAELALCCLLLAAVVFFAVRDIVLPGISMTGPLADLYAALFALALVANLAGAALDRFARRGIPVRDGLATLLSPLSIRPTAPSLVKAAVLVGLATAALLVGTRIAVFDWNYLLQKLAAGVLWCLVFAFFYTASSARPARPKRTAGVLAAAVVGLGCFRLLQGGAPQVVALLGGAPSTAERSLARHSGYDASFKLLHDALSPKVAEASSDGSIYRFLQENTNISRATKVDPVDVELVSDLQPTRGWKPNVFLFVMDSLRPDYLGAYNPEVSFTPAIDAFARDSVVMENAFTRYGATGLSEPSIWVGGMLLHKQYIEPFYPMNALQKLLETERYQSYISMDTILGTVVRPSPSIVELDQGVLNKDYDLCGTLQDLEGKLRARKDGSQPVFVYSQAQNLHVAQITRQGTTVLDDQAYPGFHAPYASRLRRVDRCFGEFLAMLRSEGLYEDSIVILTADHGDSLGEDGRWGHAYTMYPEIVRIPMIVHLPEAMREKLTYDAGEVAFLTDITPSLYYLLGHRPVRAAPTFGRPLFIEKGDAQPARTRDNYLLASSYGPVYAILSDRGRSLYIADGVNYRDDLFDLSTASGAVARQVTPEIKREREKQIREQIAEINAFYGFVGKGGADQAVPAGDGTVTQAEAANEPLLRRTTRTVGM